MIYLYDASLSKESIDDGENLLYFFSVFPFKDIFEISQELNNHLKIYSKYHKH